MKYVQGIFQHKSGREDKQKYTFLTDIEKIEVGDYAVVETVNGYSVIEVVSLEQKNNSGYAPKDLKWVVDVVDMSAYRTRVERKERLDFLEAEMHHRVAALMEVKKYEMLEQDPNSAELVKEFKQLKGLAST
jgi:hypothetical protein